MWISKSKYFFISSINFLSLSSDENIFFIAQSHGLFLIGSSAEILLSSIAQIPKEKGFIQEKPSPNKFDKTRYYKRKT